LWQDEEHVVPTKSIQQDIFEARLFSEEVMKALRRAYQSLEAPSMMPPCLE